MRLGEALIAARKITEEQLTHALDLQTNSNARLGEILVSLGILHHLELYPILAQLLGLRFINLRDKPCDPELFERDISRSYLSLQMIPWRIEGETLVVAMAEPQDDVGHIFGEKVEYVLATPHDIYEQVQLLDSGFLSDHAIQQLWRFEPQRSARRLFMLRRKKTIWMPILLGVLLSVFFFEASTLVLLAVINLVYLLAMLFKFHIFWAGYYYTEPVKIGTPIPDKELPLYTIFVPLFKEPEATVKSLIQAIRGLDYPKDKLDIKLIVEEDDYETFQHLVTQKPERIFHIVRVPHSQPQTKPKACNYALQFAKGTLATIYDAEDIPEPQQLRKAAQMFADIGESLGCVQARLNYYNRRDNLLTRLFSLEYAMWFDAMLSGLERLGLPMPLGGTSNHFRTKVLKSIHAWDPYNVTEDADLGLRLAEAGYQTRILNSLTLEEAPNTFKNWIRQRTRWVKGYIQTFFVHLREPKQAIKVLGLKGVLGFVLFIGSASFAFVITPVILTLSLLAYFGNYTMPLWLYGLMVFNMVGGMAVHLVIALAILWRHKWWDTLLAVPVFPFYWFLHTIASIRAVYQLVGGKLHHWEKTIHGVFKRKELTEPKNVSNTPRLQEIRL